MKHGSTEAVKLLIKGNPNNEPHKYRVAFFLLFTLRLPQDYFFSSYNRLDNIVEQAFKIVNHLNLQKIYL